MKKKVLIYITRTKNERTELLVFKHRDFPDAGIQVPAGSVEGDEEIEDAAIRETQEESGISINSPNFVGAYRWFRQDTGELQERNVFHFHLTESDDVWTHKVTGSVEDEDQDLIFNFYWIPINEGPNVLSAQQGIYLAELHF